MITRSTIALSIESTDVRLLVVSGGAIRCWASAPLPAGVVKNGLVTDAERFASAVRNALQQCNNPKGKVIIGLTGVRSISRMVSLPRVKTAMESNAIEYAAEREIPVPLGELYLAWERIGGSGSMQDYLLVATPRDIIDPLVQALELAGVVPDALHLSPLAVARAVNARHALIINLEENDFDLVAVADDIPVVMRTVISRSNVTAVEDRGQQLTDELTRTVQFYNTGALDHAIDPNTPAYVCGQLASDESLLGMLAGTLQYTIEPFVTQLRHPPDFPLAQYAVNVGLATAPSIAGRNRSRGPRHAAIPNPNLLRVRSLQRRKPINRLLPALAPIPLLALFVFLLQSGLAGQNELSSLRAQMTDLEQQVSEIDELAAALAEFESEITELRAQRQSILGTGDKLVQGLVAVTGIAPPGIQLISVEEAGEEIRLEGKGQNASSFVEYVSQLEGLGLFEDVYVNHFGDDGDDNSVYFGVVCVMGNG